MREGSWLRGARARAVCAAVAAYSCLLANGLSAAQERLLARGCAGLQAVSPVMWCRISA